MICLVEPYKRSNFTSVDEAIQIIREYINSETPLHINLIFFTKHQNEDDLYILKFELEGFMELNKSVVSVLGEITKDEADESWVKIYR